jgi:hypothetical protein
MSVFLAFEENEDLWLTRWGHPVRSLAPMMAISE